MPRLSVRVGRSARVTMGPLGWLIAGPFVLLFLLLVGLIDLTIRGSVALIAWAAGEIDRHKSSAPASTPR